MKRLASVVTVIAVILGLASLRVTAVAADASKTISLTFDDLPYVAPPGHESFANAQGVTDAILHTLEKFHAPATAFVTEGRGPYNENERVALMQQWVDAGVNLGNHTFSHIDLNQSSVAQFKQDVLKSEPLLQMLMQDRESYQRYFRYPFNHTGNTKEKHAEVERFLVDRGYAIAKHTIDSADYIFNVGYLYAKERGRKNVALKVCTAYADFVLEATRFAEEISQEMFGRHIAQTLLLHVNDINADCLDEILKALRTDGYKFVSFDTALSGSAYETTDTFVTEYGPTWLWRWNKSMEMNISFREDPEPPDWIMDLYHEATRSK